MTACPLISTREKDERADSDEDGFSYPEDCAPLDPLVHPGADESCNDQDDDCDELIDEDPSDAPTWYLDLDGDDAGDPTHPYDGERCVPPTDYVASDADCDDTDPTRYPGAPEICDDGALNDCDGEVEGALEACTLRGAYELSDADAIWTGDFAGDHAGWALAGAGDVDGDGKDDLLIGAPLVVGEVAASGTTTLISGTGGPSSGPLHSAGQSWTAFAPTESETGSLSGWSVDGAGDVDGDGYADILVGAPLADQSGVDAGAAALILGPPEAGTGSLDDADATWGGDQPNDRAGFHVASASDVDQDGHADLLVGAREDDAGSLTYSGSIYLLQGTAPPSSGNVAECWAAWAGEAAYDLAGSAFAAAGDVDGDGLGDVFVGVSESDRAGDRAGAVYLMLASGMFDASSLADANEIWTGTAAGDGLGNAVAGADDVDGDGYDDLVAGASGADGGASAGEVYLYFAGEALSSAAGPSSSYAGSAGGDNAGISVALAGDLDANGRAELLIGANAAAGDEAGAGAVYLILDADNPGSHSLADADAVWSGAATGDNAGFAVTNAGDFNGDGAGDLAVSAALAGDADNGAVYLLLSPGL